MQLYTRTSRDFDTWFAETDATHWRCKQTGCVVQGAIKTMYAAFSLDGATLPVLGLPTSNEVVVPVKSVQVTLQAYERGVLAYDVVHAVDRQPGMGDVYLLKLSDVARLLPTLAAVPTGLSAVLTNDIAAVKAAMVQLAHDAGLG